MRSSGDDWLASSFSFAIGAMHCISGNDGIGYGVDVFLGWVVCSTRFFSSWCMVDDHFDMCNYCIMSEKVRARRIRRIVYRVHGLRERKK